MLDTFTAQRGKVVEQSSKKNTYHMNISSHALYQKANNANCTAA